MQAEQLLQQAITAHRAGRLADAERAFRQVLVLRPDIAEVHISLAQVLMLMGRRDEAAASARTGVATLPRHPIAHSRLGDVLAAQGRLQEAEQAYRQAVQLKPDFAEAYNNLGNVLLQQNRLDDAARSYRKAITQRPQFVEPLSNLAGIAVRQGAPEEAMALLNRVFALRADYAPAHVNLGNVFMALGDHGKAIAALEKAVALQPANGEAQNNLGGALTAIGRHADALAAYRKAAIAVPGDADILLNIGNALKELGQLPEAERCYRQAAVIAPNSPLPHQHLAMVMCEQGRLEEGFGLFREAAALAWAPAGDMPDYRQHHDREQAAWAGTNTVPEGFHLEPAPRLRHPAVRTGADRDAIQAEWTAARPQLVVIDDLLSPDALASLRRFCLASSIWRDNHDEGYLGAMPQSGFAPALLAQIAEELRDGYPAIFGGHPLLHHWAFKYDRDLGGIKVHADFAAVNVNFWITPDDANCDPAHGGLVVWDVAAPLDWDFRRYNSADADIRAYLKAHNARAITVPYRANRAVIFDSDLFHETDTIRFREGYENRRINVTLLYGRRTGA